MEGNNQHQPHKSNADFSFFFLKIRFLEKEEKKRKKNKYIKGSTHDNVIRVSGVSRFRFLQSTHGPVELLV